MRTKDYTFPEAQKPVVQVLALNRVESMAGGGQSPDRWKLDLSDGVHCTTGMLATHFNELIKSGKLKKHSVLRVREFIMSEVAQREIIILLEVEVLATDAPLIGAPTELDTRAPVAAAAPAAAAGGGGGGAMHDNRVYAPAASAAPAPSAAPSAALAVAGGAPSAAGYGAGSMAKPAPAYAASSSAAAAAPARYGSGAGAPSAGAPGAVLRFDGPGAGAGAGAGAGPQVRTVPIKMLNPYQNKWTVKARVTGKTNVKTWDKGPNNSGKLFSADLIDAEGTEIRSTFFRDAVDAFYELIQVGGVYYFSDGKLKVANRQFSSIKNEYEVTFDRNAQIARCEDTAQIAHITVDPVAISSIAEKEPRSRVDVVGIVTHVGEVTKFTSKQGKELTKLEVELMDNSRASIRLTVWNDRANDYAAKLKEAGPNPVAAFKSVEVGDYQGKTLSTGMSTAMAVNPDLPISGLLRAWFDRGGANEGVTSLSGDGGGGAGGEGRGRGPQPIEERFTMQTIQDVNLGAGGQTVYVEVKGTVIFIKKENMWYPSCPTCKKKVAKNPTDEHWHCEKCAQSYPEPLYRYLGNMDVADSTGHHWVSAFDDQMKQILGGHSASDLVSIQQSSEDEFNRVLDQALFKKGVFRLRLKEEFYQDQSRVKWTLMDFKPLDFAHEIRELERAIRTLETR